MKNRIFYHVDVIDKYTTLITQYAGKKESVRKLEKPDSKLFKSDKKSLPKPNPVYWQKVESIVLYLRVPANDWVALE